MNFLKNIYPCDRLANIRDSLWRVANISSLAAVADDLAAEEVRKTLENSNLDDAIQGKKFEYWTKYNHQNDTKRIW